MKRAIVIILDSLGIGYSADAEKFNDVNANTFASIATHAHKGLANKNGVRKGKLELPNLTQLGLYHALSDSSQINYDYVDYQQHPIASYGFAQEKSFGKDTPSGHWEIAGVPCEFDWGYFSATAHNHESCFPQTLLNDLIEQGDIPGILGNCHASGTEIIARLGENHIQTGKPIVYTSADSVFQIAAHEKYFGVDKLHQLCQLARKLVDPYNIGRVIARPFVGDSAENFKRTANRKDIAIPPPAPTLLDQLTNQNGQVIAIGKIADIFAHRGITHTLKGKNNTEHVKQTIEAMNTYQQDKTLIFTNLVDFDSEYGHRRDVAGYANALEEFDTLLPNILAALEPDDLLILSADHGCDPTWPGSDHTREYIPVLCYGKNHQAKSLGKRNTFADIGQSIASHLKMKPLTHGSSFLYT